MRQLKVFAYAKINLCLNVLNKREDGFHEVDMVMQSVDLADEITVQRWGKKEIEIISNTNEIPSNKENLAYKAAELFIKKLNLNEGVNINIKKNIPIAAGLAGGSADAAAVLSAMNVLFDTDLHKDSLKEMGEKIGSDIPFCLIGGTKRAVGRGEILREMPQLSKCFFILAKPNFSVSTAWAYQECDKLLAEKKEKKIELMNALLHGEDVLHWAEKMHNDLETIVLKKYQQIEVLKNKFMENGAVGSLMSGSGPTVFGVFTQQEGLKKTLEVIKKIVFVEKAVIVEPVNRAINFIGGF